MVNENVYAARLRKLIKETVPNVVDIVKNDEQYCQGIPDHTILFNDGRYAMLEIKKSEDARHRPNQDYYVNLFNQFCYAAFAYPENEKQILRELTDYATRPNLEW